jgi:hypothetical protein
MNGVTGHRHGDNSHPLKNPKMPAHRTHLAVQTVGPQKTSEPLKIRAGAVSAACLHAVLPAPQVTPHQSPTPQT